jgi:recombinational DNA repair protein (RecF pathway)
MYDIIHTKAIIFLERREKEYDKVFFIFSHVLGFTSVTAPGVLKPLAKLNSLLQPLRVVTCDIVVGKRTKKITTVIDAHSFESLMKVPKIKISVLRVFELLNLMIPRNVPVPEVYMLFEQYLSKLETISVEEISQLEVSFLYYVFTILGYSDSDHSLFQTTDDVLQTNVSPEVYALRVQQVNRVLREIHV